MNCSARRLFLLLIVLASACGTPNEQVLLNDARVRYANGDEAGAMIQLKNLLRTYPNNKEGRLLRGELAISLEDGATAEKDYLRAQELGVERAAIVVNLGKSMMLQGAFDRVIAEIHGGTAPDDQTRVDISLLRGNAYLGLRKLDNATKAFRDALELAPNSPEARVGLGRVALAKDDIGNALTELARAVSAGSQSRKVWIANGQVQLTAGNAVEAKNSFARAIELKPIVKLQRDDFDALNGLFHSHLELDEMDQALAVAEQALEISRSHPLAHYLRAQHAMHAGDIETATTHLLSTLTAFPNHPGALAMMGTVNLQQDKLKEAETYLRQAMALDRHDPGIRMKLAQTMLRMNDGDDALQLLAPVMRQLGDVPELLALVGRATAVAKDSTEWLGYFEQAAADRSNLKWQFELAQAYIAAGMAEKSIEVLQRIPDSEVTSDRRDLILIEALRRTGKLDGALDVANRLLARSPGDSGIRLMLGQLHLAGGNLEAARSHLEAVLEEDSANISALLTVGQLELRSDKLDVAERLFREAYTKQPDYLSTVTLLVALAQSRGENDEAIEWLEAARLTNPNAVMPRVGLVALYLTQDKVSIAYQLAREAVALDPDDPRAMVALGITQIRREEFMHAIHTLEDAALMAPQSGMIQFELSKAHHGANHANDARYALRKAIALSPWRANYAVAAAKLELVQNNPVAAGEIAEDLIRNSPASPVGYSLLGKALMRQEKYIEAADVLAKAVEVGQKEEYVMQHYDALAHAGDARAQRVLSDWVNKRPKDWEVRVLLAQAHHFSGETTQAIEQYERVLQDSPENTAVLNNLAWLHLETDPARSLELAETVHRLEPYVGTFTDTLGWILVQQGELNRGLPLIRKAAQQAPNDSEIRYHLAAVLAETGEVEEARLLLTQLINSGKSFDGESEARTLLKRL